MTKLFIYGTLMRGELLAARLKTAKFLGEACTLPQFTLTEFTYFPAMVKGGTTAVKGEIYEVDATTLRALDLVEVDVCKRTPIGLDDGQSMDAYMLSTIESGDWKRR